MYVLEKDASFMWQPDIYAQPVTSDAGQQGLSLMINYSLTDASLSLKTSGPGSQGECREKDASFSRHLTNIGTDCSSYSKDLFTIFDLIDIPFP